MSTCTTPKAPGRVVEEGVETPELHIGETTHPGETAIHVQPYISPVVCWQGAEPLVFLDDRPGYVPFNLTHLGLVRRQVEVFPPATEQVVGFSLRLLLADDGLMSTPNPHATLGSSLAISAIARCIPACPADSYVRVPMCAKYVLNLYPSDTGNISPSSSPLWSSTAMRGP